AEGVAWTLKAGSDIDCQGNSYEQNMQAAYDSGLVTDADLDSELTNLLTGRFRLGEFDPADQVPYRSSEYSNAKMASAENQAASLAVSEEAPVLLKNDFIGGNGGSSQRGLPLTAEDAENIVVIGYLADEFTSGGYSGYGPVDSRTMIQGIETAAKQANPNASVEYLGDGVTPTMTMGEVCYPPWGCFPSAAWSGKPGVQGITFRDGATDLKSIAPPVNGYPASVSDNPAPDQFIFWEGWMGISWGGTYFGASSVWGGYAAIKADIPAAADALCLTQSGSTGEAPAAGIFEVHLDALDGPVVATIPAEGAASTCGVAGSDGAYSGPTGVHTLYVAYNPGTLGDFGQEGTAGHPWALAFDDTNVPSSDGIVEKIENASAVIVAVGTTNAESAEEMDRVNIDLPRFQDQLVAKVAAHNPRTVAWVQSVGQMDIEAFRNNVNVPSIVWSNYNGQHQGITAGNILFGKVNPSGKLPLTWYSDLDQLGTVWDYGITPTNGSLGRTYEYFTGRVSYPFGHGLSYSNFQYSNLKLDRQSLTADGAVTASVTVTNSSSVPGKETVELYVTAPGADGIALPKRQLKGFEKVSLGAFASTTVSIEVKAQDLWFWDEDAAKATWPLGTWNIQVGPKAGSGPVASFQLTDQPVLALDVVKAIPDGAVLNTAAPKTVIHSNLSASRSDQSFFDLADPAVQVSFASADPAVATVDQRGVVAPAGEGVTTITATVTAAGSTKSDSYAVVVEGADADPVVNVADQVVQLSQAASIPLGAQLALVPAGAATSVSYLIAGMDENTAGATVDPTSGVVTATQPGKVRVTVLADIDGVKLSQAAEITVVADQAAPVAQITAPAAPGSGAYTAPVELDIAGQWGSYTVYPTVEVSIDGGAWQVVTGPVRIAGDGEHTVSARVTDELGQVSPTTTATVKIDTSAPSLGAVTAVAADGVLTLTSADPDVAGFEYSPDGVNWKAYTAPLKITGWIYYRAVDAAGNRGPSDFVSVPAPAAQTPSAKPGDTPAAPKTLKSAKPKIKGTAKVGKKLKAVKGTWTAGAAVKFQWYAGSKAIKGATKASLTLKKAQAGKKIRVKATGTKTGYKSKSVTSKATKKVKK
ncbi:MAG: glycoside hydrolase family 3 C-terminal domain-containing protein, partial [Bifidobacteriaceae bacterium]|nr:glycoside hydrolase family 3 C-terminal domain-containing protein [Bifidobacteriaceae bacterium]